MKKDANTILLFTEHRAAIDYLSDEDAGKLIKALFAYVDEGQLPDFNGPMMSLFMVIRTQIDRSHEAYKAKCERNSANAKKRFAIHSTSATASSGKPSQANACHRIRTLPFLILIPLPILFRIQALMMVQIHTSSMMRRQQRMKNTHLIRFGIYTISMLGMSSLYALHGQHCLPTKRERSSTT